jgi:hypothetical protein
METPAQRAERIVAALEDLSAQEAASVAQQDWASVVALQDRMVPLVEFLAVSPFRGHEQSALRSRIAAVHARRAGSSARLEGELERTRKELEQTQLARRRVAQIAPAYGRAGVPPHRLHAVG